MGQNRICYQIDTRRKQANGNFVREEWRERVSYTYAQPCYQMHEHATALVTSFYYQAHQHDQLPKYRAWAHFETFFLRLTSHHLLWPHCPSPGNQKVESTKILNDPS